MTASPGLSHVAPQPAKGRHRLDAPLPREPQRLATLAVIAGFSGALSTVPLSPVLQSALLIIFTVAGIGSAALCWIELPAGATAAAVIGLSVAGVVAVATSLAWTRLWYPVPSCLLLSFTVAVIGLLRLWTLRQDGDGEPTKRVGAAVKDADVDARSPKQTRRAAIISAFCAAAILLLALGIWVLALPMLRGATAGQWGLLATSGGLLLLAAVGIAVTGFVVAIAARHTFIAAAAILVVIVLERVTVPLITEVPIYTWTYKHIGVVDYIVKFDALPPAGIDVYNQWPGFFTAMGWFSSVTNLDLVNAAHWFTPVADALIAALVATLALSFGSTIRAAVTAAMIAQIVNWVGQDYYSPQALAVILATAILALLAYSTVVPAAGYASVPIFAVLVASHQLTPLWVCGVVIALALCRQIKRHLAMIYVAILVAYLVPRYTTIKQNGFMAGFNPFQNTKPVGVGRGSDGRVFSVLVERGLAASLWLTAGICFVILWRRGKPPWAAAIMAFSPLAMLFGVNYGGEAILRVFLYSSTTCAVLIAPFLTNGLTFHRAHRQLVLMTGCWFALVLAAAAGLQGYYGSWTYITVTRQQLEQAKSLLATNQVGTKITVVMAPPAGWPERPTADYVKFAIMEPKFDTPLDELRNSLLRGFPTPEAIDTLEADPGTGALYIVLPRQVWAYNAYIGLFPPGALESLVEQISQRPTWVKIIDDGDTLVYQYMPDRQ